MRGLENTTGSEEPLGYLWQMSLTTVAATLICSLASKAVGKIEIFQALIDDGRAHRPLQMA